MNACTTLQSQNIGLKLVKYESGLKVLQCDSYNSNAMSNQILDLIEKSGSVSAHDLAISANVSIALARQRLIDCENAGIICRDESIEGLRFYPNKFV